MTLTKWKIKQSRYVLKDQWMTIRADQCETREGKIIDPYYVQEPSDWIQIVAFDSEDRILVTKQYRHDAGEICIEIPCGCVESDESPRLAIERELLEETGCKAEFVYDLPPFSPNPDKYSNKVYPFYATGVQQISQQNLDENENIEFEFISIKRILELIDSGKFQNPLHIVSIFNVLRKRKLLIDIKS